MAALRKKPLVEADQVMPVEVLLAVATTEPWMYSWRSPVGP